MELHQLEYFVAVAEEANFTRAAARMHVAQPGVSAQIRRLEREIGQPLLDRSGRTVRLTDAGRAALPYARAALAAVAGVRQVVDELSGLVRGHVAIGTVTSTGPLALPDLLAEFHDRHPSVEITLTEASTDVMLDALREGTLDLAIAGIGQAETPGVATRQLVSERLMGVCGPHDRFARRARVTLAELAERPLICLPKGTGMRGVLDAAFATSGLSPRIAFEAGDPNVLVRLATRGLGVAMVPESLARYHEKELPVLEIRDADLLGSLALAWRAEGTVSPAARALIALAQEFLPGP